MSSLSSEANQLPVRRLRLSPRIIKTLGVHEPLDSLAHRLRHNAMDIGCINVLGGSVQQATDKRCHMVGRTLR